MRRAAMAAALPLVLLAIPGTALRLQVRYPEAGLGGEALFVRGDGCGLSWGAGTKLAPQGNDTFTALLDCGDAACLLAFKSLVADSVWQAGANEVVSCGAAFAESAPWFYATNGSVQVISGVWSPQLNNSRDVALYLPPSWSENPYKRYSDVLLAHDGNNLFSANSCPSCCPFGCWDLQQHTLDPLILQGALREVVVVGPYNNENRTAEYTYSRDPQYGGGQGDLYLDFLERTLLPRLLGGMPRLQPAGGRVAMLGSSLGGLLSCYAGWRRWQAFGPVACMSSSFWWNGQDFNNSVLAADPGPSPRSRQAVYLDSGSAGPDDDDEAQTLGVRAHLQRLGFSEGPSGNLAYFLDRGGRHNEQFWGARVYRPLTWFFGTQRQDGRR